LPSAARRRVAQNQPPLHSWFDINNDNVVVAGCGHIAAVRGSDLFEVWPEYRPHTEPNLKLARETGKAQWVAMYRGTPYVCTAKKRGPLVRVNCHMAPDCEADVDEMLTSLTLLLGQLRERLEDPRASAQSSKAVPGQSRRLSTESAGSRPALRLVD
jgi:hypothetical protein